MVAHFSSRCCGDNHMVFANCSVCTFAQKCIGTSLTFGVCMYTYNHRARLTLMPRVRLWVVLRVGLGVGLKRWAQVQAQDWTLG